MIKTLKFKFILIVSLPVVFSYENNLIYDGNGNLVTGDSYYREYNGFGQLIRIRNGNLSTGNITEEFVWHPVEEKILQKKVYFNNGTLKERVYYINQNYIVVKNSSGNFNETYVYQDNALAAQITTDGNKQAIHNDNKGSNNLVTDANGTVVENNYYSPFGEALTTTSSRFTYEMKEYDNAVQDVDFHFRKYKPQWGKFTQPDTLIQNVYDPQSLNRYAF